MVRNKRKKRDDKSMTDVELTFERVIAKRGLRKYHHNLDDLMTALDTDRSRSAKTAARELRSRLFRKGSLTSSSFIGPGLEELGFNVLPEALQK